MVAIYQPGETIYVGRPQPGLRLAGGGGRQLAALYNSLVGYWKLDEASGNRADSVGANTLTDNNTVGSTTGLVYGTAAEFVAANSEYLSITDNAALSMGDIDFWIGAWVRLTTITGSIRAQVSKYRAAAGERAYALDHDNGSSRFRWFVSADGAAVTVVSANTFGAPVIDTWYFIETYHDATNNLIGIAVNGGAFDTTAHTGGVIDNTAPFRIGGVAYTDSATPSHYANGRIGPVMISKNYIPTTNERALVYNAGAGLTLAQMAVT